VKELLSDLEAAGGELIVFIDDLDRCTPATTAQVLEAINLFLSESFPRARFVLGLDPEVVAAHIDRTYTDLLKTSAISFAGDPTPGWTFLRKLVQLPIMLPTVADESIDRLLDATLAPVVAERPTSVDQGQARRERPAPPSGSPTGVASPTAPAHAAQRLTVATPASRTAAVYGSAATAVPSDSGDPLTHALERHPDVRERLRDRLTVQPERSAREAKRMLTIWQFYVRLFQRIEPLSGISAVDRARNLVLVAEIISRWPAQQSALRRPIAPDTRKSPQRGLQLLADAVSDDLAWGRTLSRLALEGTAVAVDLRQMLLDYDGARIADLYARIT